jgi:hypothetical protein
MIQATNPIDVAFVRPQSRPNHSRLRRIREEISA